MNGHSDNRSFAHHFLPVCSLLATFSGHNAQPPEIPVMHRTILMDLQELIRRQLSDSLACLVNRSRTQCVKFCEPERASVRFVGRSTF
jgi:hypothetical protein